MAVRYPLEYRVNPRKIESGRRWIAVNIKNVGAHPLTALDIRLNSLDAYGIKILGDGSFVSMLQAGEARLLPFQVMAQLTTNVYLSVEGWEGERGFRWETPGFALTVDKEAAELVSFFVLTEPYLSVLEAVRCEATVKGIAVSSDLSLEFWADAPHGAFNRLGDIDLKPLGENETVRYTTEFTPREEGLYTIYAYLYDGMHRIGRKTDTVYVSNV